MANCGSCGARIPPRTTINGRSHVTSKRKFCLACRPFKYRLTQAKELAERRQQRGRERSRDWYRNRVERWGYDPHRLLARKRKEFLVGLVGAACQFCGYSRLLSNLVFHHVDEKAKRFELSVRGLQRRQTDVFDEVCRCVVACHNCHGEIHGGIIVEANVRQKHRYFELRLKAAQKDYLALTLS